MRQSRNDNGDGIYTLKEIRLQITSKVHLRWKYDFC